MNTKLNYLLKLSAITLVLCFLTMSAYTIIFAQEEVSKTEEISQDEMTEYNTISVFLCMSFESANFY